MALKSIKRGEALCDHEVTGNLLNEEGEVVLRKLAKLLSECLSTLKYHSAGKRVKLSNLQEGTCQKA